VLLPLTSYTLYTNGIRLRILTYLENPHHKTPTQALPTEVARIEDTYTEERVGQIQQALLQALLAVDHEVDSEVGGQELVTSCQVHLIIIIEKW